MKLFKFLLIFVLFLLSQQDTALQNRVMLQNEPTSIENKIIGPNVLINIKNGGLGSGVIIGRNKINDSYIYYVLTAHHVIKYKLEHPEENIVIKKYYLYHKGAQSFEGIILNHDEKIDIALLMFKSNKNFPMSVENKTLPPLGDDLWMIGNPAGLPDIINRGTLSSYLDYIGHLNNRFTSTISTYYGNSGGGIYNKNLELIGIVVVIPNDMSNYIAINYINSAIKWEAIKKWLDNVSAYGVYNNG